MKTFLKVIGIIILVIIVAIILLIEVLKFRNTHYYNYLETNSSLEKEYSKLGKYKVSNKSFDANNDIWKEYKVWYPTELENSNQKYPMVVMANGTGVTASNYSQVFKHLASWGFIVIGNEDANSKSGESSSKTLDYFLKLNEDKNSIFYQKIDTENIGITGHSQGGVAVINATNNWENGKMYKTISTVSATSPYFTQNEDFNKAFGGNWEYDVTKIKVPYFFSAGTGAFDAGTATSIEQTEGQGITPLYAMEQIYNDLTTEYKVMGRLSNADHGETNQKADAYVTAWFMYWLQNDEKAKDIFFGDNADILNNSNWQDVKKSF